MALVNIKIEGQPYQVDSSLTVLEAARKCGYEIPSLCAFNHGKCSVASCRVCLVEVKGARGLCQRGCPANCISATEQPAKLPGKFIHEIDQSKCVKCGACMSGCRFGAIIKR